MGRQGGIPLILLVDDDAGHNAAMRLVLERAGYGVVGATDGREALSTFMTHAFDLVITDLSMPRMNGLELLRSIRAADPEIGVIIITAFGEWTSYVQAINIGALEYLSKPLRRQELLSALGKALTRRGMRVPEVLRPDPEEVNESAA